MSPSLEQIVSRLGDPESPLLWLDPSLPERFWEQLPQAAAGSGFRVFCLDESTEVTDLNSLLAAFSPLLERGADPPVELAGLRQLLLALPDGASRGWAVLFRHPEPLRQNDEVAFEEFLEIIEAVHEARFAASGQCFNLVVRD